MCGVVATSPVLFYQLWRFISPGLYKHEKALAVPVIVSATVLFFAGVAFCQFVVFAKVFTFFREIAPDVVAYTPDIAKVFGFVTTMFLAFGLTFEIPVVVILLVRMGLVSVAKLQEIRGYVIVGAFIVAAVVTPPDVLSQLMLAVPMVVETPLMWLSKAQTWAMTDARLNVLPVPVAPSRTWWCSPVLSPSTSRAIAAGWSPVGSKGATSFRSGTAPILPDSRRVEQVFYPRLGVRMT